MLFGTISSQIRMSFLKTKADFRINNIYLPKGNESAYLQTEKLLKQQRIGTINSKLKAGQTLSQSELAFLRDNAPQLYAKAIKVMKERADYRDQLSKCKTKDEVQKVNTGKLQELASSAQQVSGSNMDAGAKLDELEFIQMRMSGIMNEHMAFTSSSAYHRLPWEHEKQRDEKKKTIKLVSSYDRMLLLEAEQRERNLRAARQETSRGTQTHRRDTADFSSHETLGESAAERGVPPSYTAALPGTRFSTAEPGSKRLSESPGAGFSSDLSSVKFSTASPEARSMSASPVTKPAFESPGTRKGVSGSKKLSITT